MKSAQNPAFCQQASELPAPLRQHAQETTTILLLTAKIVEKMRSIHTQAHTSSIITSTAHVISFCA